MWIEKERDKKNRETEHTKKMVIFLEGLIDMIIVDASIILCDYNILAHIKRLNPCLTEWINHGVEMIWCASFLPNVKCCCFVHLVHFLSDLYPPTSGHLAGVMMRCVTLFSAPYTSSLLFFYYLQLFTQHW